VKTIAKAAALFHPTFVSKMGLNQGLLKKVGHLSLVK